jgi:hypothetical protein
MNFMAAPNENNAGRAFNGGAAADFAKGPGEPGLVSVVIPPLI